jgi:hypothetical protein
LQIGRSQAAQIERRALPICTRMTARGVCRMVASPKFLRRRQKNKDEGGVSDGPWEKIERE